MSRPKSCADALKAMVSRLEAGETVAERTKNVIKAALAAHGIKITNGDGTGARLLLRKKRR